MEENNTSVLQKLLCIQQELQAPKNQYSEYGGFFYRNCEDILLGLKPLLKKYKAMVTMDDEILCEKERYYVKARASLVDVETGATYSTFAYAREDETKKKMDASQMTGSASSYARKYALNGLFAIDDGIDSDDMGGKEEGGEKKSEKGGSKDILKRLESVSNLDELGKIKEEISKLGEKMGERAKNKIRTKYAQVKWDLENNKKSDA